MAETLILPETTSRKQLYEAVLPQLQSIVAGEKNVVANLANIAAVLKEAFGFFWVGFYMVEGNELVLGPFQGPLACTRITMGRGVCGSAWQQGQSLLVPDVEQFPGHIACSSLSKSEVVVPIKNSSNEIIAVLDVDSDKLNDFDQNDVQQLEAVAQLAGQLFSV